MNSLIVNIVLVILIILSITTWSIAVLKIKQFRKIQSETKQFTDSFWDATDWASGKKIAQSHTGDLASLARLGFEEYSQFNKNPNSLKFVGEINEILDRPLRQETQKILRRHEKGLAELASIGSVSPFIGLFGTVWGIMNALSTISQSGQASIDIVAGPIGEALIATAIGIATAIPAVLFYNYFLRKMKIELTEIDGFTDAFVRLAAKQVQSNH